MEHLLRAVLSAAGLVVELETVVHFDSFVHSCESGWASQTLVYWEGRPAHPYFLHHHTLPIFPDQIPFRTKMSDLPVTCNCIGYHALRQHVTQLDANARNRAIEQTRNSLLNPSMFVF